MTLDILKKQDKNKKNTLR